VADTGLDGAAMQLSTNMAAPNLLRCFRFDGFPLLRQLGTLSPGVLQASFAVYAPAAGQPAVLLGATPPATTAFSAVAATITPAIELLNGCSQDTLCKVRTTRDVLLLPAAQEVEEVAGGGLRESTSGAPLISGGLAFDEANASTLLATASSVKIPLGVDGWALHRELQENNVVEDEVSTQLEEQSDVDDEGSTQREEGEKERRYFPYACPVRNRYCRRSGQETRHDAPTPPRK